MKQQCYLAAIYLNWVFLAGGFGFLLVKGHYLWALGWLAIMSLALWLYIRAFPSIAQAMGYGRVDDRPAQSPVYADLDYTIPDVTLYTAFGCPFCPIVKRRLHELQGHVRFQLREVDVTLRPGVLTEKHIRAVPAIEVGDRRMEGNATSEQLAELLRPHVAEPVRS